mgnify:CR=1 FL=1
MKTLFLLLVRFYRGFISPMFPPSCRYVPTCSEYALEAIERYGARRGGTLAKRSRISPESSATVGRVLWDMVTPFT